MDSPKAFQNLPSTARQPKNLLPTLLLSLYSSLGVRLASWTNGTPILISFPTVTHTAVSLNKILASLILNLFLRGPSMSQHPEAWKSWGDMSTPGSGICPELLERCGYRGRGSWANQRSLVCLIKNLGLGPLRNRVPRESFKQERAWVFKTLFCLQNGAWTGGSRKMKHLYVYFQLVC